jgi:hypothetical protein
MFYLRPSRNVWFFFYAYNKYVICMNLHDYFQNLYGASSQRKIRFSRDGLEFALFQPFSPVKIRVLQKCILRIIILLYKYFE